mmetsp:Transcript_9872/g.17767  ORF Transcript_9872/g.17767 Transcript_9872/m.17767 type:complete len:208 (-) Transcript_9872:208-831(-)
MPHLNGVTLGAGSRVGAGFGVRFGAVSLRDASAGAGALKLPAVVRTRQVAALQPTLGEGRQTVRASVLEALPGALSVAPQHHSLAQQLRRVGPTWVEVAQHRHRPPLLAEHKLITLHVLRLVCGDAWRLGRAASCTETKALRPVVANCRSAWLTEHCCRPGATAAGLGAEHTNWRCRNSTIRPDAAETVADTNRCRCAHCRSGHRII